MSPDEVETYRQAIAELELVMDHISSGKVRNLWRAICTWPVRVPKHYVDLLVCGDLFARVIYAHWLVLNILVEDYWWVDDMGTAGVREIAMDCQSENAGLASLMEWPEKMLQAKSDGLIAAANR